MAGPWRPYFLLGYNSVEGDATEGLDIVTGANEEFEAEEMRILSTGTFDITGLTNESGLPFTNADSNSPLDYQLLRMLTAGAPEPVKLPGGWNLPPSTTISFSIRDTSSATNEVWILLIGKMRTP